MENEKSIVRVSDVKLPKFVEQAYDSIEGMKQFANMLLESKLVPDSYYEKGVDKKPDYTKGKTSAVVIVLLQAQQLNVPPMTGLQHIVPVNGLLSIKGDLAKTMIFASGKLRKDTWKEVVTGSIENEDMVVSITATRDDNGITLTRTFSIDKAKRMGLWVTKQMVEGQDGWKHQKSAWYKTPDRMINYRALGNLARDLFSDVLLNMYTTEEAMDLPRDTTEVIETTDGNKIIIPDKEHTAKRSAKMTERVADKIQPDKFAPVKTEVQDAVVVPEQQETPPAEDESPFKADKGSGESMNGVKVLRDPTTNEITNMDEINAGGQEQPPAQEGKWTLKEMEAMDTKMLLARVNSDMDMMEGSETIGGKNTNKKLREIIFAWQEGKLAEHVAPYLVEEPPASGTAPEDPGTTPNKNFDQQKADKEADEFLNGPSKPSEQKQNKVSIVNKYGLDIVEKPEGANRDFSVVKNLFNQFLGITPKLDNPRYLILAEQMGYLKLYPDREIFLKSASVSEINVLLNNN